jgi:hypothetical protein
MWKLADLFVQITGDSKPLASSLLLVKQQLMGFGGLGGRIGMQLTEGIAGPLLGLESTAAIAGVAIGVGVGAAAAAGLIYAGKMASNLNETIAKTEQVFGSFTNKVTEAADEMAHSFGIPKSEFLDAASMFGLIAQGAGIASGKSADMAVSLSKLAADASSFFNTGVDVALEKIRAGLVGESEPLRAFGVMLTEDNVKAKALAMGLAKPGKELTNQMKIMARYQLIQEGLAKAQGDLERTGGGFANQWRQFTGQLENMATTVGQFVLPVMTAFLRAINQQMQMLGIALDWIKEKWDAFWEYVGMGADKASKAAEQADIDARNAKMQEQITAEEAKAQAMKKTDKKAFHGSLEDYAKRVAEGAAGNKTDLAKQQLQVQKAQLNVLQQQLLAQKGGNAADLQKPAVGPLGPIPQNQPAPDKGSLLVAAQQAGPKAAELQKTEADSGVQIGLKQLIALTNVVGQLGFLIDLTAKNKQQGVAAALAG